MKRRDFLCGASCLFAGFALGHFSNKNKQENLFKKEDFYEINGLGGLTVAVSSHCNLNCKNCDVYAPLAKEEFVTYEQFSKDMEKIKELAPDREISFAFMGGEPLLNPDLTKIINKSVELFPNSEKTILTNGILLDKMSDDFWDVVKTSNMDFGITKYPVDFNMEVIEEKAKKYGFKYHYDIVKSNKLYSLKTREVIDENYNETEGFDWSQNILDLKGTQNYIAKRFTCPHRGINVYARGNIYYCYVHAYIKAFIEYFKVDIPITKEDYIKIADVNDIKEIDDFLSTPKPLCRYCKQCHNTCYGGEPLEWGFSKREITEWT